MADLSAEAARKLDELRGIAESIDAEQIRLDELRAERNRMIAETAGLASERAVADAARVGYAYVGRCRRGGGDPQAERRAAARKRKRGSKNGKPAAKRKSRAKA